MSNLKPDETLVIIIEEEFKGLITAGIKIEKLPVTYEEVKENDLTRILIRLKQ